MGSSESVPANDPLLNDNTRQRTLLNSIYQSNSSIMPHYDTNNHDFASVEVNPPKVKKTKTYKNPILLKRASLRLV